jgi:molybdopterin synthase catalytic subunit
MADACTERDPVGSKSPPKETRTTVAITSQTIDVASLSSFVADEAAGANSTFVGTTRDTFQGKRTLRLEYEAYEPMALRAMEVTGLFVCGGLY